ncbi:MAG TPA: VOC family protein [Candidatus Saccharimonadales bacterium]|nr:VOC family protein [Candidatus Saccharimonadales bacterium]
MLADSPVCATIAVKDLEAAKKFYGDTLGLKDPKADPGGVLFKAGEGSAVYIYQSEFAGSNKATYAAWNVSDVKAIVDDLKGKGIEFNTFDAPGITWEDEIATMGPAKAAWFNDPDGNILNVVSGM